MNALQKEVLGRIKSSIKKWGRIVDGDGVDQGKQNCALCAMCKYGCAGCPIMYDTGMSGCRNTPYIAWENYQVEVHGEAVYNEDKKVFDEISLSLAEKMVGYLTTLLGKKEVEFGN